MSVEHTPLFGPLPKTGVWTAVGLTRGQFSFILLTSIMMFVVIGGPLWRHVHDKHLDRLAWSYLAIPALVGLALQWNGRFRIGSWLAATSVLSLLKLIATAGLLGVLGVR